MTAEIYAFPSGERIVPESTASSQGERRVGAPWRALHRSITRHGLEGILGADEEGPRLCFPTLIEQGTRRVAMAFRDGDEIVPIPGITAVTHILSIAALFVGKTFDELLKVSPSELPDLITGYEISLTQYTWGGARWQRTSHPKEELPRVFGRAMYLENTANERAAAYDRKTGGNLMSNLATLIATARVLDAKSANPHIADKRVHAALGKVAQAHS